MMQIISDSVLSNLLFFFIFQENKPFWSFYIDLQKVHDFSVYKLDVWLIKWNGVKKINMKSIFRGYLGMANMSFPGLFINGAMYQAWLCWMSGVCSCSVSVNESSCLFWVSLYYSLGSFINYVYSREIGYLTDSKKVVISSIP